MESKWISVEERLPAVFVTVWIFPECKRAYYGGSAWRYEGFDAQRPIVYPTHWAEIEATLPPPPRKMVKKKTDGDFFQPRTIITVDAIPSEAENIKVTYEVPE